MENSNSASPEWNELIEVSKKFSTANKVKLKYEEILNELTIFQNLIDFGKGVESKILTSLFTFTIQAVSDPDFDNSVIGENLLITVENISDIFTFNREYWYFSLDINRGSSASVWRFEKQFFKPGDKEKFIVKFTPNFGNSGSQEIKISLILSLLMDEKRFLRIFQGTRIFVDVLHLLSPGKRLPYSGNTFDQSFLSGESSGSNPNYPPIDKFHIKLKKSLRHKFPTLFLNNSLHRGFGNWSDLDNLKEFTVYFESEKIVVTLTEDLKWIVQCSNPQLLFAIKVAIYKRLLHLQGLKIESPSQEHCEMLCKLKFKLESTNNRLENCDFHEIFLLLREVSEQIQFYL